MLKRKLAPVFSVVLLQDSSGMEGCLWEYGCAGTMLKEVSHEPSPSRGRDRTEKCPTILIGKKKYAVNWHTNSQELAASILRHSLQAASILGHSLQSPYQNINLISTEDILPHLERSPQGSMVSPDVI